MGNTMGNVALKLTGQKVTITEQTQTSNTPATSLPLQLQIVEEKYKSICNLALPALCFLYVIGILGGV